MNGVYFAIFIHFENVFQPELSIGVSKLYLARIKSSMAVVEINF